MSFNLAPDAATACHGPCQGNPATNDWIPVANDMVKPEWSPYKEFNYLSLFKEEFHTGLTQYIHAFVFHRLHLPLTSRRGATIRIEGYEVNDVILKPAAVLFSFSVFHLDLMWDVFPWSYRLCSDVLFSCSPLKMYYACDEYNLSNFFTYIDTLC